MGDILKKASVIFDFGNEDSVVVETTYPATIDTVTMKFALPARLATTFENWMKRATTSGELPENMDAADIIMAQALAGFLIGLEKFGEE